MKDLPPGWAWARIEEIAETSSGGTPSRTVADYFGGDIPWLKSGELRDGPVIGETDEYLTRAGLENCNAKILNPGTILVAMYGATTGRLGLLISAATTNQAICAIEVLDGIEPRSLFYLLLNLRRFLLSSRSGGAQPNINQGLLANLRVPVPPSAEQRRIVAEIEKHLSALDAGCALLAGLQRKLTKCIDGILSTALLSPLEHKRTDDQALGQRIRAERKHLSGSTAALPPDNFLGLVAPEGWEIMSLDELTTRITSGSRDWSQYYGVGDGTFIMAQNVRPGRLDLSFRQPVNPPLADTSAQRSLVQHGDLLVTIVGANTGDACAVLEDLDQHYVCQSVALLRPVLTQTSKYLMFWLLASRAGAGYFKKCLYGQGRPHLGFDQIKRTPVLVPPLDVMNAIVERIEDQLSLAEAAAVTVEDSKRRAARLRQAILHKAFAGKLVPQDPNDEPASVLLDRIRASRAQTPARRAPLKREVHA